MASGIRRCWADRAVAVGTRQHAPAPAAIGRVAVARLLIFDGRVEEGLELLDEAAVSTVSGELDPLSVGIVYCELVCAIQGLAQYDRAEERTAAMERWRHGQAFGGINGRCRVHRAETRKSSGCAGPATRRRRRRSMPATSFAHACGGSSAGRSPSSARSA